MVTGFAGFFVSYCAMSGWLVAAMRVPMSVGLVFASTSMVLGSACAVLLVTPGGLAAGGLPAAGVSAVPSRTPSLKPPEEVQMPISPTKFSVCYILQSSFNLTLFSAFN